MIEEIQWYDYGGERKLRYLIGGFWVEVPVVKEKTIADKFKEHFKEAR